MRNGHGESRLMQQLEPQDSTREITPTALRVVTMSIRMIETHAERQSMPRLFEHLQLMGALQQESRTIGQDETRTQRERVQEYFHDVLDDQGLAAREHEALDAKVDGRFERGAELRERWPFETYISGPR